MELKCGLCGISSKKTKHKNFRDVSKPNYSWISKHIKTVHKKDLTTDFLCTKDLMIMYREQKDCKSSCCHKAAENTTERQESRPSSIENVKTIAKTNSVCIVCRAAVTEKCQTIPKEAQIDILIEHRILIPDGSRICSNHLNGKHALPGLNIQSTVKPLKDSDTEKALEMLFTEIHSSTQSPINFDGDMDYKTWTGKNKVSVSGYNLLGN